jgi:cold shock CspA family protein
VDGTVLQFEVVDTPRGPHANKIEILSVGESSSEGTGSVILAGTEGEVIFWSDLGYGFIQGTEFKDDVFAHYSSLALCEDGYLNEGDIVRFDAVEGPKGIEAKNVEAVGWRSAGSALNRFADMGNPRWFFRLKGMAEEEDWYYRHSKSPHQFPVLRSYIHFTFQRLQEMKGGLAITNDEQHATFNTGLVTTNQEEIYGVFFKNPTVGRQPWKLRAFLKASDRDFLNHFGANPPPLAEYFQDPHELLFDRRLPLYVSIDHVLRHIERFPEGLRDNLYLSRQLLVSAEVQTKKRVYRNYKTAIPQYFREGGGVGTLQLLLPICLQNPSRADLALTVERTEQGDAYRGSTVLTLDMAYNNARLLARPDTEWLQP